MLKIRAFARDARVSRRHMNFLLGIFRDLGFSRFPLDYRTFLNECKTIDSLTHGTTPFALPSEAILILVCGFCWLSTLSEGPDMLVSTCAHCDVTTVRCPRPMCYSRCVLKHRLGGRAMSSLIYCIHCEIGPDSRVARRTFSFPL